MLRNLPAALALTCLLPIGARAQQNGGYRFEPLQTIPGNVPGGGGAQWDSDFEPGGINNNGQVVYVADMSLAGFGIGEGAFAQDRKGAFTTFAFPGMILPGDVTYIGFAMGQTAINDRGDTSLALALVPFGDPFGTNTALYRGAVGVSSLTALVLPGDPAPGGGTFAGVYFNTGINTQREIVFGGLVPGADIDPMNPPGAAGIGLGLFKADGAGRIACVVRPGDPAPGGGVFDSARPGTINNKGDIAFPAHSTAVPCIDVGDPFFCGESVYLRDASKGTIVKVAQQGDPAPGGKTYRVAFDPRINERGDVVFIGDVSPGAGLDEARGVYLYDRAKGTTAVVAQPGRAMPGGGLLVKASSQTGNLGFNSAGDVAFSGLLDTDANHDGEQDTGLYLWSKGTLTLITRSGSQIPGVGTVAGLRPPGLGGAGFPFVGSGAAMNDSGQVFFQVTLTDGVGVLLIASPRSPGK
jgi:hypothetical protein